eukprot:m.177904 g.177904  ORF g.177904 m.177904 type:complete len:1986 (+) comp18385_c0_seq1:286-6243(+)
MRSRLTHEQCPLGGSPGRTCQWQRIRMGRFGLVVWSLVFEMFVTNVDGTSQLGTFCAENVILFPNFAASSGFLPLNFSNRNLSSIAGLNINDVVDFALLTWVPANTNVPDESPRIILDFSYNNVKIVDNSTFTSIAASADMTGLFLQGNFITIVESDAYAHFPNLSYIDMSHNQISSLSTQMFANNRKLLTLDYSYNAITYIASEFFGRSSGPESLTMVSLRHNVITMIETGAFSGCEHLTLLDVSSNLLPELDFLEVFSYAMPVTSELPNVTTEFWLFSVCAQKNQITALQGSFDAIDALNVASNQITSVNIHVANLRELNLSGNLLATWDSSSAEYGTNSSANDPVAHSTISIIDASHNSFTTVPLGLLQSFPNVQTLLLSDNLITSVNASSFQYSPSSLKHLDLSHNEISEVGDGSFLPLTGLVSLFLQYNKLYSLGPRGTTPMTPSAQDAYTTAVQTPRDGFTTPTTTAMSLDMEYDEEDGSSGQNPALFDEPVTSGCGTPDTSTLMLVDLSHNNLVAVLRPIEGVSTSELIYQRGFGDQFRNIQTLTLSNNQLTEAVLDELALFMSLSTIQLSGNSIASVSPGWLSPFPHVADIDLFANDISLLSTQAFASSPLTIVKQTLHMSINAVTVISSDTFTGATAMSRMDLSSNKITFIEAYAFADTTALEFLALGANALTGFDEFVFFGLGNLVALELFANDIETLDSTTFQGLSALTRLSVMGNAITFIGVDTFVPIKGLFVMNSIARNDTTEDATTDNDAADNSFNDAESMDGVVLNLEGNPLQCSFDDASNPTLPTCTSCTGSHNSNTSLPYIFYDNAALAAYTCSYGWQKVTMGNPMQMLPSDYDVNGTGIVVQDTLSQSLWGVGVLYVIKAPNVTVAVYGNRDLVASGDAAFSVDRLPTGFLLSEATGLIQGVPLVPYQSMITTLYIHYVSNPNTRFPLYSINFTTLPLDTSVPSYGPNSLPCYNGGVPVDGVLFDHSFTCNCSATLYTGPNCDEAKVLNVSFAYDGSCNSLSDSTASACGTMTHESCWGVRSKWALNTTYHINGVHILNATVDGTVIPTSEISFELFPQPPGLLMSALNATAVFDPSLSSLDQKLSAALYAVYTVPSAEQSNFLQVETLRYQISTVEFQVLIADLCQCKNGGTCVDKVQFDGVTSCNCTETDVSDDGYYTGVYCETLMHVDKGEDTTRLIIFASVAVSSLAVVMTIAACRARKYRQQKALKRKRLSILCAAAKEKQLVQDRQCLHEALELDQENLIVPLIQNGACASVRDGVTNMLPHYVLLTKHATLDKPLREYLLAMFEDHFELDQYIGKLMAQNPVVLEEVAVVVQHLALTGWYSTSKSRNTVLHCLVDACRMESISSPIAAKLADLAITTFPSLLTAKNSNYRTAADLCARCDNAPELEKLLTVTVFDHYQLPSTTEFYSSDTSLVLECRDLRIEHAYRMFNVENTASNARPERTNKTRRVLKLMSTFEAFAKELRARTKLGAAMPSCVVPVVSSTCFLNMPRTFVDDEVVQFLDQVHVCRMDVLEQCRNPKAQDLMQKYPFAICMPMAERNLQDILKYEQMSKLPLGILSHHLLQIGSCIAVLHDKNLTHGDIKPRNIVRINEDNSFRLIDLDISQSTPGESSSTLQHPPDLFHHQSFANRLRRSSAYLSPEAFGYVEDVHTALALDAVANPPSPVALDIWSFGAIIYEVVTGAPLLKNANDVASYDAEQLLRNWTGLTTDHIQDLKRAQGEEASASVVNLLKWMLDGDVTLRPTDLKQVFRHDFFHPEMDTMREHFMLEEIRCQLRARRAAQGSDFYDASSASSGRMYGRVMISYSWNDTPFVLKLAMALASKVEDMWLDRLGGDNGMQEWAHASIERGIRRSDFVLAVVSPAYIQSPNCGFEMATAAEYKKKVIPLLYRLPYNEFPPAYVGGTKLQNQMSDAFADDVKMYVDFTSKHLFNTKLVHELLPAIRLPGIQRGEHRNNIGDTYV